MIFSPSFFTSFFFLVQPGKREKKKNEAKGQGPRKYRRRGRGMRETTASAAACVTTFTFFFATVLLRHEAVRSSAKLEETHGCGNGHAFFFVPVLLKIVPFFESCFVLCRFPLLARRIIKAVWQMPQRIAKGSALTSRSIRSGAPIGEKCKL